MNTAGVVDLPAGVSLDMFRSWSGMDVDASVLSEQRTEAVAAALQASTPRITGLPSVMKRHVPKQTVQNVWSCRWQMQ